MAELKIGIVGCAGRMGCMLVRQIAQTEGCALAGGTEPAGSDAIGADIGVLAGLAAAGVTVGDDAGALFAAADAVLEFTAPAATVEHARLAAQAGTIHVIGTTGLDAALSRADGPARPLPRYRALAPPGWRPWRSSA